MRTIISRTANKALNKIITYLIAGIWLINGLFCKLFDMVPRHREIVVRISGVEHAAIFTKLIGAAEVMMVIWIISGIKSTLCATVQVFIILTMNIIEFYLAPDLLLFGKMNLVFAVLLSSLILYNEFVLTRKIRFAK